MNNYLGVCLGLILIIFCLLGCSTSNYGHFEKLPDMNVARARHKSFLMQDGRVLLFGGDGSVRYRDGWRFVGERALKTAEIYDPKTNSFTMTKGFSQIRYAFNSIVLDDGRVLITGGQRKGTKALKQAEIYDPISDTLTQIPDMNFARQSHTNIKLKDGKILLFGGSTGEIGKDWYANKAEIYDPKLNKFILLKDSPSFKYGKFTNCLLLSDGKIFIVSDLKGKNQQAELFDPVKQKFIIIDKKLANSSNKYRNDYHLHNVALLEQDKVALFGTNDNDRTQVDIFHTKSNKLEKLGSTNAKHRLGGEVTPLKNGNLLISNGSAWRFLSPSIAGNPEMFNTRTLKFYMLPKMIYSRFIPTTILLKDGKVLITGGQNSSNIYLKAAEMFIPKDYIKEKK